MLALMYGHRLITPVDHGHDIMRLFEHLFIHLLYTYYIYLNENNGVEHILLIANDCENRFVLILAHYIRSSVSFSLFFCFVYIYFLHWIFRQFFFCIYKSVHQMILKILMHGE